MNPSTKTIPFAHLATADLFIDAMYEGGKQGNAGDDPISRLVGVGNQGGFRYIGSPRHRDVRLCVLYSELTDPDWPDALYPETGVFIYYGDNKRTGHELHDTRRKGNLVLKNAFSDLHKGQRDQVPPFFIFTKAARGRDVVFRGVAVTAARGMGQTDDLVAIWKTSGGERFQNYRAVFTVLDIPNIPRNWLKDIQQNNHLSENAPAPWRNWIETGYYQPLVAPRSIRYRTRQEQLPTDPTRCSLLDCIVRFYKEHPDREYAFEKCAAEIVRLMDPKFAEIDLTRPWKDGGRDAVGLYRIGSAANTLPVEFALEAKCKIPDVNKSSGVRETSRLISRLRYRQFGIFITTSFLHEQAFKEIIEDGHPVLVLSGADIAEILIKSGFNDVDMVLDWLKSFS
jgi:hypothetical protein